MAGVMNKAHEDRTNKVVVLQSSKADQLNYAPEYMHGEILSSQPPYWMLGVIRRENFRISKDMNASIIIYNTECAHRNHLSIFVDLYSWTQRKQDEMLKRFPVAHTHIFQCKYTIPTNLNDLQRVMKSLLEVVSGKF